MESNRLVFGGRKVRAAVAGVWQGHRTVSEGSYTLPGVGGEARGTRLVRM